MLPHVALEASQPNILHNLLQSSCTAILQKTLSLCALRFTV